MLKVCLVDDRNIVALQISVEKEEQKIHVRIFEFKCLAQYSSQFSLKNTEQQVSLPYAPPAKATTTSRADNHKSFAH